MIYIIIWWALGAISVVLLQAIEDGYLTINSLMVSIFIGFIWPLIFIFVCLNKLEMSGITRKVIWKSKK